MALAQAQRFCKLCRRHTLHGRAVLGVGMGCILSVLTAGLFIPVWMVISVLGGSFGTWRCQTCGKGRMG